MDPRAKQGGWGAPSNGPKATYTASTKKNYELLQPGMVYFPRALDMPTQQWFVGNPN